MNNTRKVKDLRFGFAQEDLKQGQLEKIFGKLNKTSQYHSFDYFNEDYFIEMKSRKIKHDTYWTIWFENTKRIKADELRSQGWRTYFTFNLLDGIYIWEYTGEECKEEYFLEIGGRSDRGKEEKSLLVNVKTKYLIDINKFVF